MNHPMVERPFIGENKEQQKKIRMTGKKFKFSFQK